MEDWIVKIRADRLLPGTRFIFAEEFGGEGEVLTVAGVSECLGTVEVATEELGWELVFTDRTMVQTWDDLNEDSWPDRDDNEEEEE